MTAKNLTTSQAWTALNRHAKEMMSTSISDLFKNNPLRSEQLLVATSIGIFDFAKNNISEETIKLLDQLFSETELNQA
ncbi:MAG: hypothetical protein N4A46_05190, partial [Schleiferiaceae bacterium]|nr:hypothetical protein [Schleiferiaceae bacterium]